MGLSLGGGEGGGVTPPSLPSSPPQTQTHRRHPLSPQTLQLHSSSLSHCFSCRLWSQPPVPLPACRDDGYPPYEGLYHGDIEGFTTLAQNLRRKPERRKWKNILSLPLSSSPCSLLHSFTPCCFFSFHRACFWLFLSSFFFFPLLAPSRYSMSRVECADRRKTTFKQTVCETTVRPTSQRAPLEANWRYPGGACNSCCFSASTASCSST